MRGVDRTQLTPLAEILVWSYLDTAIYSRQFKEEYEQPPTTMAKVHHLLAIAQAHVNKHEQLQLCPEFIEYGKLQVIDQTTKRTYLVRSSAAVAIEDARQGVLFPRGALETPIIMVIHRFHPEGLDLSIAGTRQQPGRQRLVASGPATFVATWPFITAGPTQPFDQGQADPFGEVGPIEEEDEGGDAG